MSELVIPDKCVGCPQLDRVAAILIGLDGYKENVTAVALSDEPQARIVDILERVQGMDPDSAKDVARDVVTGGRKEIAGQLDRIDDEKRRMTAIGNKLAAGCEGRLRMRARTRVGRMATVTICGSGEIPDGTRAESVYVRREQAE